MEKSNLIIIITKKHPDSGGKKHCFNHVFPRRPRLSHLWTEKERAQSVGEGHQSAYSPACQNIKNYYKDNMKKYSILEKG